MKKKKFAVFIAVIIIVATAVPVLAAAKSKKTATQHAEMQFISVWQIDGFEGGKGSRKQYISSIAQSCFKDEPIYVKVTSLEANSARENLKNGVLPDAISYPAGFYGIEELINKTYFPYVNWCQGSYCIISTEENCTFDDVNKDNTVINCGKGNLYEAAAAAYGIYGAGADTPTDAYLKLKSGKYKYLLGTQRDVFRFKTRNMAISVKPVTEFNDLYQCFSIIAKDDDVAKTCKRLIDCIKEQSDYDAIGLFKEGAETKIEELKVFNNIEYKLKLNFPCTQTYCERIRDAVSDNDINKIKNLIK